MSTTVNNSLHHHSAFMDLTMDTTFFPSIFNNQNPREGNGKKVIQNGKFEVELSMSVNLM